MKVRKPRTKSGAGWNRCDSGTDGIVRMGEDRVRNYCFSPRAPEISGAFFSREDRDDRDDREDREDKDDKDDRERSFPDNPCIP